MVHVTQDLLYFKQRKIAMVVKVIVANDYNKDIYVMVQGDRKFSSSLGVQAGAEILGNGINFGLNKDVIWETAKTMGYTKIKSKCYTPFYTVADSDAVYVTIFCEEMERKLCRFLPVEKKYNVISSTEGYLCFSQKEIWDYDDNQKPGKEQSKDAPKEDDRKRKADDIYQENNRKIIKRDEK